MSVWLRVITLGLCGRGNSQEPTGILGEQRAADTSSPDPTLVDNTVVPEQSTGTDALPQKPCRLTDREKETIQSYRDVNYARTLVRLGQERARALNFLRDFEQDTYLSEAISELREESPFRKKLEQSDAKTFEDALDLTSDWQEVHNLLSAAGKAAVRKYVTPKYPENKTGSYYKSPRDGSEVQFETASPYSLHDDLKEFRKQYGEIKKLAGLQ